MYRVMICKDKFNTFAQYFLTCLILCLPFSCSDEIIDIPDYTVSGQKVSLQVPVSLPVMDHRTRSGLSDLQLNTIENLWIRTYSAVTGKATSEWLKLEPSVTLSEQQEDITIETESGLSYIIAVANVENLGVSRSNISDLRPLSELLTDADTWEKFLDIAVVAPHEIEDVRAPHPPLPMAGCYSDLIVGGDHPEPSRIDEWQKKDFIPYFIPVKKSVVEFPGAIHLRRLVSHVTFNFIPGDKDINLTINSFQVMNAPKYSWLYERPTEGSMTTNFGDLAANAEDAENYYADVQQYNIQYIKKGEDGINTFDFWQSENKHKGTSTDYHNREETSRVNPTLYTSLTGDVWTPNNEASYIIVSGTLSYENLINVNENGEITPDGTKTFRSADVIYYIHLGYTGTGTESEKSKDFNCFRNVDYTYNVTVNGVDDIRVDAYATDETYHGEEGIVVDLQNATYELDCHYNVFNIELTEAELNQENIGFIIMTYDNGRLITLSEKNPQEVSGQSKVIYTDNSRTKQIDPAYYNWIELRPTTDANTLAIYKPRFGSNSDGKTFLLTDIKGGWNNMLPEYRSTSGYYTVYVNEYTYEPMYTGTDGYANEEWNGTEGYPKWMHYVNQNPRRFYIQIPQSTSPDGNSIYSKSKYGVTQSSLMTYYSEQRYTPSFDGHPAGTAIAAERINETLGLNLRHTFPGGTSYDNGRWNTAMYLNNANSTATTNLNINNSDFSKHPEWSRYISESNPLEVPEVSAERLQGGSPIPGRTIANGNPEKIQNVNIITNGSSVNFTDPQPSEGYNIEAISACINRNRDNNGNGRIDPDELRWVVPGLDMYIALTQGEAALPEPLMNFSTISRLPFPSGSGNNMKWAETGSWTSNYYTRYMFTASNNGTCVLWGHEGTSVSTYIPTSWTGVQVNPWNIRCIRNLGANLTSVTEANKVQLPYIHVEGTRTVRMNYFNMAAIRTVAYTGNGNGQSLMPVHTINSHYNDCYYGFEYAPDNIIVPDDYLPSVTADDNFENYDRLIDYVNSNPCGNAGFSGSGWRVPNQEELTLMYRIGLFSKGKRFHHWWLASSVSYIDFFTGYGSNSIEGKFFIATTVDNTTILSPGNLKNAINKNKDGKIFVRCVRDRN